MSSFSFLDNLRWRKLLGLRQLVREVVHVDMFGTAGYRIVHPIVRYQIYRVKTALCLLKSLLLVHCFERLIIISILICLEFVSQISTVLLKVPKTLCKIHILLILSYLVSVSGPLIILWTSKKTSFDSLLITYHLFVCNQPLTSRILQRLLSCRVLELVLVNTFN